MARSTGGATLITPTVRSVGSPPPPGYGGAPAPNYGVAPVATPRSPAYYGGFPNPYAGNIYAGLPSTIQQTPYGSMFAQAKQYLSTPQQLRTIAGQQTQAQISGQLGASYANQTAEQAQLQAMQNRASGLAGALGSFGPDYASAMQNAYTQAAGEIGAIGPGVIQQGQGDMSAALDAAKAQVAAKTGGQGEVSSYDPSALASTLSTTGVQMPGDALALQGYNAAQMGLYGAMADKGQVQGVAQYYQQQAVNALQQRTAERASIIAQQPALYQQALEAQRQDNVQTQNQVMNTLSAGQNYIASLYGRRLQTVQAQNTYAMQLAQMNHVNPYTGQPLPGYVPVTLKDGSQVVVSYADAAKAAHYADQGAYWGVTGNARQTSANASLTRAQSAGNAYNPQLSQQVGYLVDTNRQPIVGQGGKRIPYTSTTTGGGAFDPKLSAQLKYLVDKNRNPILGANGMRIPYTAPVSAASTRNAATGGLTPNESLTETSKIKSQINSWFTGSPGTPWVYRPTDPKADANGYIYKPGTAVTQLSYQDALRQAVDLAPNKAWTARVKQWVAQKYSDPTAIQSDAQQAYTGGYSYSEALAKLKTHYAPGAPVEEILKRIYYGGPYSPIAGGNPASTFGSTAAAP